MPDTTYTIDVKIREIKREIAMRHKLYKRKVERGTMTPEVKERRIGIMQNILEDYEAKKREQEPTLFEQEASYATDQGENALHCRGG